MLNMTAGELTSQLDLSALPVGLHSLTMRTGTDDGRWGSPVVRFFIVPQPGSTQENQLAGYEYWIDSNFDNRASGTFSEGGIVVTDIDMSAQPAGLHSFSFRALDDNGNVSSVLTKFFIVPQPGSTQENQLAGYEYWIDRNFDNRVSGTFSEGGIVVTDIDMSAQPAGLHSFSFRALDNNGNVSSVLTKFFIVPEATATIENSLVSYRYWIDKDVANAVEETVDASGIIDLNIDLATLDEGLHSIGYQVKDAAGVYGAALLSYFLVPADPSEALLGDNIVAYEYWFNDNPRKRVEVEPAPTLTIDAAQLAVEGVEPATVPADYEFDVTAKSVVYTLDIEFGLQVFNNLGTGSTAVTQTIEGHKLTMDTNMQTLANEQTSTLPAATGCQVQGYQFSCSEGEKLYWFMDLAEGSVVDFYDGEGTKIAPEAITVETIDEKTARVITATTTEVYALVYGATADGESTVRVAKPITITARSYSRKYGDENPEFEYEADGDLIGSPLIVCEADATTPVGDYPITLERGELGNAVPIFVSGTLTIEKETLTVSVGDYSRNEGEENPEFKIIIEGFKNGEDESVLITLPTATTVANINSGAGEYEIIVEGGEAENYDFEYKNGTLTVNPGTGIRNIAFDRPMDVFDMHGKLIRRQTTTLRGLPPGVYIVGGKKVELKRSL